jgi:Zn-dependent protease
MVLITFVEILDALIMSALIGFILMPYFSRFNIFRRHTVSEFYTFKRKFNWSDFMFTVYLVVPAIIIHELGHKLTATAFGYDATFFSAISINKLSSLVPQMGIEGALLATFLNVPAILMIIAVITTLMGGMFLFFVPAYVAFTAAPPPLQIALIAFAGPFVNLILWLVPKWMIKAGKISHKYLPFAVLTSRINMILFIFNMIPFPGFDGYQVLRGLITAVS